MKLGSYHGFQGSREAEKERRLVEARIGEMRLGIDIMAVIEIVAPRAVIPLPGAPAHVIGVADHRDRVVPVIDLRRRLNLQGAGGPRAKWVIAGAEGTDTAFLVDEVAGVIAVGPADRREHHPLVSGGGTDWIGAVHGHGQGLVFELDLAAVTGGVWDVMTRAAAEGEAHK